MLMDEFCKNGPAEMVKKILIIVLKNTNKI